MFTSIKEEINGQYSKITYIFKFSNVNFVFLPVSCSSTIGNEYFFSLYCRLSLSCILTEQIWQYWWTGQKRLIPLNYKQVSKLELTFYYIYLYIFAQRSEGDMRLWRHMHKVYLQFCVSLCVCICCSMVDTYIFLFFQLDFFESRHHCNLTRCLVAHKETDFHVFLIVSVHSSIQFNRLTFQLALRHHGTADHGRSVHRNMARERQQWQRHLHHCWVQSANVGLHVPSSHVIHGRANDRLIR